MDMWEVCLRHGNGEEQVLNLCSSQELALKYVDALYSQGYPLHFAYIVRPARTPHQSWQISWETRRWSRLELA